MARDRLHKDMRNHDGLINQGRREKKRERVSVAKSKSVKKNKFTLDGVLNTFRNSHAESSLSLFYRFHFYVCLLFTYNNSDKVIKSRHSS